MQEKDQRGEGWALIKREERRISPRLEIVTRDDGALTITEGWEDQDTHQWMMKQSITLSVVDLAGHPSAITLLEDFVARLKSVARARREGKQ